MLRIGGWVPPAWRYPELVPADAVAPEPDSRCLICPAPALVVLWKVSTKTTGSPMVYPRAGAGVTEASFCGHDATAHEDRMSAAGWTVVYDRRQLFVDTERIARLGWYA